MTQELHNQNMIKYGFVFVLVNNTIIDGDLQNEILKYDVNTSPLYKTDAVQTVYSIPC